MACERWSSQSNKPEGTRTGRFALTRRQRLIGLGTSGPVDRSCNRYADAVRRNRYIGVCIGPPGIGKTLSGRTYSGVDECAAIDVVAEVDHGPCDTNQLETMLNGPMDLVPMTLSYAEDIVSWCYPPPYDCYDMNAADPAFLADPGNRFYAVIENERLIAFRSFGADGQVPGGPYDASALDTGGGLRPELIGQGIGNATIRTGLAFGDRLFQPDAFRVTIASFNRRALHVVTRLGFERVAHFNANTTGRAYDVLVRRC